MAAAGPTGPDPVPFTEILERAVRGEESASASVLPRVYRELQALAKSAMGRERAGHTLQATALVHECWMRLCGGAGQHITSRAEFFRNAAEAMRRILIEHARRRARIKRGGGNRQVTISGVEPSVTEDPAGFLALDEAIGRLREHDPLAAEIVRLRFYAGLTANETAEALGLSLRTVMREWAYARARLFRDLAEDVESEGAE